MKPLTINDIDEKIRSKIYVQTYSKQKSIEGVKIINLKDNLDEESDFTEIIRLKDGGEVKLFPGFFLRQVNRTKLYPAVVKAWHLHFKQDEIWYALPSGLILVGLWDTRGDSKTKGILQRVVLGGGKSDLLYIPRGVAHGVKNLLSQSSEILYFINEVFDPQNPDERRICWDAQGAEFWTPHRD